MPYAEDHFLSRLDRVALPHVELALALFRDPGLLRYLLARVSLPERAERVAISLEQGTRGPFVVVTRAGAFVTCLGEGMSPGRLHVVARAQLDGATRTLDVLRKRLETAHTLLGRRAGSGNVLLRIVTAGPWLSREEVSTYASFAPLVQPVLARLYVDCALALQRDRDVLVGIERPRPALNRHLRRVWQLSWACGHLALLACAEGSSRPDRAVGFAASTFTVGLANVASSAAMLRGAWCAARCGKAVLPVYKHALAHPTSILGLVDAALGLGAMGARHARLHAEIDKLLRSEPGVGSRVHAIGLAGDSSALRTRVRAALADPEAAARAQQAAGAAFAVQLGAALPRGHAYAFERAEDVPASLALPMALQIPQDMLVGDAGLALALAALPWVARASVDELYLPADYVRACKRHWQRTDTLALLAPWHELRRREHLRDAQRPPGPSRKRPCPCGSGKKYKRCCEAERAA